MAADAISREWLFAGQVCGPPKVGQVRAVALPVGDRPGRVGVRRAVADQDGLVGGQRVPVEVDVVAGNVVP